MIIHHDYSLGLTWDCSCAEVKGAAAATAGGLQGPPAIFINIVSEVTAVCVCVRLQLVREAWWVGSS